MQDKHSKIITDFLKQNSLISVSGIENELNMPDAALRKAMTGERLVPKKFIIPIIIHLLKYGLNIEGEIKEEDIDKINKEFPPFSEKRAQARKEWEKTNISWERFLLLKTKEVL